MTHALARLDATAQAELVADGEATPLELVDAAIDRIEQLNPKLNAVVSSQFERAREQAEARLPDGPFRGVPFLLKDLGAHLAGDPVYVGMDLLKRLDWREPGETHFAGRLLRAGLVSLGRTNSPELGLATTTEPRSFGASHNPWNLGHSPGGSSGGSAAAVAAGLVPAAHASDGGGSIRIPAAHCGLVGLKPTRGRCSFGPDLGERWNGFSVEGFVTRSVRDAAALLDVVAGPFPGDPYAAAPPARPYAAEVGVDPGTLRIGWSREDPASVQGFLTVIASSIARALDAWSEKIGRPIGADDVEPLTWAMAESGRSTPAPRYIAAVDSNHAWSRAMLGWWTAGFDLLLTPTCAAPPPPLGHFAGSPDNPLAGIAKAVPYSIFTSPFNVTGQPALSLPLHWSGDGLPIGVQLVAATGREDLLVRVAAQLEQALPWRDRVPPLHAAP
jgi:amidase